MRGDRGEKREETRGSLGAALGPVPTPFFTSRRRRRRGVRRPNDAASTVAREGSLPEEEVIASTSLSDRGSLVKARYDGSAGSYFPYLGSVGRTFSLPPSRERERARDLARSCSFFPVLTGDRPIIPRSARHTGRIENGNIRRRSGRVLETRLGAARRERSREVGAAPEAEVAST